jgi:hypothetical protein
MEYSIRTNERRGDEQPAPSWMRKLQERRDSERIEEERRELERRTKETDAEYQREETDAAAGWNEKRQIPRGETQQREGTRRGTHMRTDAPAETRASASTRRIEHTRAPARARVRAQRGIPHAHRCARGSTGAGRSGGVLA